MESEERERLTGQSSALRLALKAWEKDFAAKNEGRKASREDIKKHTQIAEKYKEYNKLRDNLSGKIPKAQPTITTETPKKRKHEGQHVISKRLRINKTPSKTSSNKELIPWEVDPYESPSVVRSLFTPSKKTAIRPTPQKDGQVLGIFDLLQEESVLPSPSKAGEKLQKGPQFSTPRKTTKHRTSEYSRTPGTAGKRRIFDMLATPLEDRHANEQEGQTPLSISKIYTPSFLRRGSQRVFMPAINEGEECINNSPEMVRGPKKPLVRGLSSMLAGLRKMEDEAADDDLDALREMENEMAGGGTTVSKSKDPTLPQEGQPRLPLGGFDDEAMLDSEPEEQTSNANPDGKALKAWKKKGQKRTTRLVKMKPTRSKPSAPSESHLPLVEGSEDEAAEADEVVPETQLNDTAEFGDARNYNSDSASEYTASEGGTRHRRPNQNKNKVNKDGKVKKATRKVNAAAHQNFKRLKLRNSGAKGGLAHNSRFRRKK